MTSNAKKERDAMIVHDDLGGRDAAEIPVRHRNVEQGFADLALIELQDIAAFTNTLRQDLTNGR